MVPASQLRVGMAIKFEGQRYKVVEAEYHGGQGRMGGSTHARLQNLDTRTFWEHSFRSELKIEEITLERQALEFLYADGDQCCFMNPVTYEQTEVAKAFVGDPQVLEVKIVDTAPPIHQQQDSNYKPAKLANGVEVMVPQFVKTGDTIRLDVPNMKYMDRAKTDAKAKHG